MPPNNEIKFPQFPFLTRKMLSYEQGVPLALRLTVHSNSTSVVKVTGFTKDAVFSFEMEPVGDLTQEVQVFRLTDFPIWLSIVTDDDTLVRGDVYAKVEVLIRETPHGTLAQGYVSSLNSPSWPNGNQEDSLSGLGKIRLVTGSDPAAGAEFSETVPANLLWRLIGVAVTVVTDVTVQNRFMRIVIGNGSNDFDIYIATTVQTASQTRNYFFSTRGIAGDQFDGNEVIGPMGNRMMLPAGFTISSDLRLGQAGDDIAAPFLYVEQWILPS